MSLIQDDSMHRYYLDAKEDIEYRSAKFWFSVLHRAFPIPPFEVSPEISPDGSLRRVDAVVERYQSGEGHTTGGYHLPVLWVEFKRPSGSPKEAESQALDAAKRCIQRLNLVSMWAMTTIGVNFRIWVVTRPPPGAPWQLTAVHGGERRNDIREYVDASWDTAWNTFYSAVELIKNSPILMHAPVVPSQSRALAQGIPDTGLPQVNMNQYDVEMVDAGPSYTRRSTPSSKDSPPRPARNSPSRPAEVDPSRSAGRSSSRPAGGSPSRPAGGSPSRPAGDRPSRHEQAAQSIPGAGVAGPSRHEQAAQFIPGAGVAGASSEGYAKVRVKIKTHLLGDTEVVAYDEVRRREFSSAIEDWRVIENFNGKKAWIFEGRSRTYYTRDKIPRK